MPTFDQLSPRQQRGIAALCHTDTVRAAAKLCRIPADTLYRWLREPAFQAGYREVRYQVMEEAFSGLQKSCTQAVQVLVAAMRDEAAHVRLAAARAVLDLAMKARAIDEVEARLTALEHPDAPGEGAPTPGGLRAV
jgi:hypothetical protein